MCFNFVSKLWYILNNQKFLKLKEKNFRKFWDEQSLKVHFINRIFLTFQSITLLFINIFRLFFFSLKVGTLAIQKSIFYFSKQSAAFAVTLLRNVTKRRYKKFKGLLS